MCSGPWRGRCGEARGDSEEVGEEFVSAAGGLQVGGKGGEPSNYTPEVHALKG